MGTTATSQVCVGQFAGAHGVRGFVRLKPFTAVPEDATRYGPVATEDGARHFKLALVGTAKGVLIVRIAGIADRYGHMHRSVKTNLTITRVPAGVVAWSAGGATSPNAGDEVTVGPDFFRATPEDQISLLLQALAFRIPDVERDFIPAYVSLAAWIHSQNP